MKILFSSLLSLIKRLLRVITCVGRGKADRKKWISGDEYYLADSWANNASNCHSKRPHHRQFTTKRRSTWPTQIYGLRLPPFPETYSLCGFFLLFIYYLFFKVEFWILISMFSVCTVSNSSINIGSSQWKIYIYIYIYTHTYTWIKYSLRHMSCYTFYLMFFT